MKQLRVGVLIVLFLMVAWLPFIIGAWDNTLPADSSTWNLAAGYIRDNWDAMEDGTAPINYQMVFNVKSPEYGATGDGTTDDTTAIAAAVTAAGTGGIIFFPEGTYLTTDINISGNHVTVCGTGYESVIKSTTGTTNSLNVTGAHCKIYDLYINGNSIADKCKSVGGYTVWNRVYFIGHNTYNLEFTSGGIQTMRNCFTVGKPVWTMINAIHIDTSNLNGNGTEGCIIIDQGTPINITNSAFESYAGIGIDASTLTASIGILNIQNCYFESAFVTTATIHVDNSPGASSVNITGVYDKGDANTAKSLIIGATQELVLLGNYMNNDITLPATGENWTAHDRDAGIDFRSQTTMSAVDMRNAVVTTTLAVKPASGTWAVGDMVYDSVPAAGKTTQWICTGAGTPGTWAILSSAGGFQTLANNATPTVLDVGTAKTGGTTTITDFDDGITGQLLTVLCKHSLTFDTTTAQDGDHNLDGSSANITAATGDVLVWLCEDGTTWQLQSNLDASADNN